MQALSLLVILQSAACDINRTLNDFFEISLHFATLFTIAFSLLSGTKPNCKAIFRLFVIPRLSVLRFPLPNNLLSVTASVLG